MNTPLMEKIRLNIFGSLDLIVCLLDFLVTCTCTHDTLDLLVTGTPFTTVKLCVNFLGFP